MACMLPIPVRRLRSGTPEEPAAYECNLLEAEPTSTAFLLVDVYCPSSQVAMEVLSRSDYDTKLTIMREHIAPALAAARAAKLPVVYVANSAPRIALERSPFGKQLAAVGTDFAREFAEEDLDPLEFHTGPVHSLTYDASVAPQPGDYYLRKHAYSGFWASRLEPLLRNLGVRTLVAVGFRLDACLGTTLMDAHQRGFLSVLLRDCTIACDTPEEQPNRTYTARMVLWYQTLIGPTSTSGEFVSACERLPST